VSSKKHPSDKPRRLCDLEKKGGKQDSPAAREDGASHRCRKCHRSAASADVLCKPEKA